MTTKLKKDTLAEDLAKYEVMMERIEELKAELEPLEEARKAMSADLAERAMKLGQPYVKTPSGLAFNVATRSNFGPIEGFETEYEEWAKKNGFVKTSIDTPRAASFLKRLLPSEMPKWVEERLTRYLVIKRTEEEAN
jgi:hypothetical protein